jgi:hypothetical protein
MIKYNANEDIRELVKRDGIYLWQIAYNLGVSDSALSRKLRNELSLLEKNKVLEIIAILKKRREGESTEKGRDTDEHCGAR